MLSSLEEDSELSLEEEERLELFDCVSCSDELLSREELDKSESSPVDESEVEELD